MAYEAKGCRHVAAAVPEVRVSAASPRAPASRARSRSSQMSRIAKTLIGWRGRLPLDRGLPDDASGAR
jgi:hypothetical protein